MNITKQPVVIGGRTFPAEFYRSVNANNNWLGWLEGIGEEGPADGSQLDKLNLVDANGNPVTWTAQAAKNNFEFPFNIVAIQIPPSWDYWALKDNFAIYIKETLNADKVGIAGYSLGGRGTWACLQGDTKNYIDFIISICGYYDTTLAPISSLRTVPGYSVHGDQDTQMNYKWDLANINAYNVGKPFQKINGTDQACHYLQTVQGAGHAVWPIAFDVTPGKDGLYQWTLQQFGLGPVQNYPVTFSYDGKDIIASSNGQSWKIQKQ